MKQVCFMCLKQDYLMREVRGAWAVHGMTSICETCGDKANKFISYSGKKKEEDKAKLKSYLNTGAMVQRKYSAQINAGYY